MSRGPLSRRNAAASQGGPKIRPIERKNPYGPCHLTSKLAHSFHSNMTGRGRSGVLARGKQPLAPLLTQPKRLRMALLNCAGPLLMRVHATVILTRAQFAEGAYI